MCVASKEAYIVNDKINENFSFNFTYSGTSVAEEKHFGPHY